VSDVIFLKLRDRVPVFSAVKNAITGGVDLRLFDDVQNMVISQPLTTSEGVPEDTLDALMVTATRRLCEKLLEKAPKIDSTVDRLEQIPIEDLDDLESGI
tara:strand:+ start:1242 stop:1541 length:300 start_codon:yes stop_codon:yes gene_type:complete